MPSQRRALGALFGFLALGFAGIAAAALAIAGWLGSLALSAFRR